MHPAAGTRSGRRGAARELDAAGICDPLLRLGYQRCRALTSAHGKTYYLATLLLPPAKRPYVHALYGFARLADDIVDVEPGPSTAARFAVWRARVQSDLAAGRSADPALAALIDTVCRWDIPLPYFSAFLDSMQSDLTVTGYPTFDVLERYMWGSAAVIGLQMLPVLGRADDSTSWAELEPFAVDLGIAFQLTNFLRDVAEDLRRGRVYLPQESLERFDVDRDRLAAGVVDAPVRRLLAHELARARNYYERAAPGIELVSATSRDCLRTAVTLYSEILDEIERAGYDVFTRRATVGLARRARIGAAGLIRARGARRGQLPPAGPRSTGSAAPARSRTADPPAARTPAADR
jgi:phytoene synthase